MSIRSKSFLHGSVYLYVISQVFYGFSFYNVNGRAVARLDWLGILLLAFTFTLSLVSRLSYFRSSPVNKFVWLYIMTVFLSLASMFNASNIQLVDFATKGFALFMGLISFFILSSVRMNDRYLKTFFKVWFCLSFVVALYGIYQLFARTLGLPFASLEMSNATMVRGGVQTFRTFSKYAEISSVFKEPGWLGSYMLSTIIFFGLLVLNKQDRVFLFSSKHFNRVGLFIFVITLFISGALGANLFFALGFVAVFFGGAIPRTRLIKSLMFGILLLIVVYSFLPLINIDITSYARRRISGFYLNIIDPRSTAQITSYSNRYDRFIAAIDVWRERPVVGVGLNNVGYYNWKYVQDESDIGAVNNGWAALLAEQGILGFSAMFLVITSMVYNLWKESHRKNLAIGWYTLLSAASWLVIIDAANTLITHSYVHSLRWFTLGVANLILIESRRRVNEQSCNWIE